MDEPQRKVIVYIAMSLDGFIAKPGDDLNFLAIVQKDGEDYGYANFISTIDTVIIGRRTYEWVMKQVPHFPHADKTTFVISRTEKHAVGKTQFYSGGLKELITSLKTKKGKNIYCDGGAQLVNTLLNDNLVDELIISIIPILVGDGTRLFQRGLLEKQVNLISTKQFETGLTQLHYTIIR